VHIQVADLAGTALDVTLPTHRLAGRRSDSERDRLNRWGGGTLTVVGSEKDAASWALSHCAAAYDLGEGFTHAADNNVCGGFGP
jgi:hypothetical protein